MASRKDSVCFERVARMSSFAAVLIMLGHSSMYTNIELVKKQILCLMVNDYDNRMTACVSDPIFLSAG